MILKEYYDNEYINTGYSNFRVSVRGIIIKDDKIGLLKIESDDLFGQRNHYEVCGGGVERGENRILALKREIKEETGINISNPVYIGQVIDRWNSLSRINAHHYYYCYYTSEDSFIKHEDENGIVGIEWKSIDDFILILKEPKFKINKMIHIRELFIINEIKKIQSLFD